MTGLYLYQTVHLARGRARHVAVHIAVPDAAARELFGRPYAPAAERLAKRIETLSAAERYPAGVSGFVRIELDPDVWMRLATGITSWDEEKDAGRITAVGERDDLSGLLPLA